jgi:hypothetical protein
VAGTASSVTLDESRGELIFKDSPSTSSGEVIEIDDKFRDTGLLKFPCFRVNARFDPGLSGGPMFNGSTFASWYGLVVVLSSILIPKELNTTTARAVAR